MKKYHCYEHFNEIINSRYLENSILVEYGLNILPLHGMVIDLIQEFVQQTGNRI